MGGWVGERKPACLFSHICQLHIESHTDQSINLHLHSVYLYLYSYINDVAKNIFIGPQFDSNFRGALI